VTVVMPCFDAAAFVEQAVRSVLEQTLRSAELIVVDDGSTDGSAARLAALQVIFGDRLTVLNTQRAGPYPARNLALKQARGEFIAFLDADDWWEPDFLESMLAALQRGGADVAYCGWQNIGTGVSAARGEPYVPPDYFAHDPVEQFLETCPWPIHAAVVRRSVVEELAGFSERMFSSMDYDFWIRMLAVTRQMVRVPRVLAYYRWHGGGQISAVKSRQVLHAWQVRRDFVANNPGLVSHLSATKRRELVDAVLLRQGRSLFWRRNLGEAQPLLREALRTGAWGVRDIPLLGAAQLTPALFHRLVRFMDGGAAK
jgi:glycosyltransferase involved in cell wall biosynthesis